LLIPDPDQPEITRTTFVNRVIREPLIRRLKRSYPPLQLIKRKIKTKKTLITEINRDIKRLKLENEKSSAYIHLEVLRSRRRRELHKSHRLEDSFESEAVRYADIAIGET
jgi:hypothetical protein